MESKLYNQEGKEVGTVALPGAVFGVPRNNVLLRQVILAMKANARQSSAHTKNRSEVSGGGKKPWRQKGTGRARHGSSRSPLWRSGGVTFGPRTERSFEQKINKKERAKALALVLSEKERRGEVIFLDTLLISSAKTKDAKAMLARLAAIPGAADIMLKRKNAVCVSLPEHDTGVERSFQNLGNTLVTDVMNVNPLNALQYKYMIIARPDASLPLLEKRMRVKKEFKM